jgi:signal transduction histidine kinase
LDLIALYADRRKITIVIRNLLSNALKFMSKSNRDKKANVKVSIIHNTASADFTQTLQ